MGPPAFVEYTLGKLTSAIHGHDAKLFTKGTAFASFPEPTLSLSCPECGPSGSTMKLHHTQMGDDRFPNLTWEKTEGVKDYILLCEDADLPLPVVIFHGCFYGIPGTTTEVTASDVEMMKTDGGAKDNDLRVKSGFKYVKNAYGTSYGGPKPLLAHGPHRYFYQLVALKEPLDLKTLGAKVTKDGLGAAIVGKVAGWGQWVGVYERKWE